MQLIQNLGVSGRIILKLLFGKLGETIWGLDSSATGWVSLVDTCECMSL